MENKQENPAPKYAAIKSPHDDRDYLYSDIGRGSAPFDWNVGYDSVADISAVAGSPISVPIKDQNGSGSCGGQAESYGGAQIAAYHLKAFEEKSAKFTYAPVAYIPGGGGSNGRDLAERARTVGWGSETLTSSYDNGKPPSEAFMERKQDITQAAIDHAGLDKALSYTILPIDIDSVAQAIRDFKFVRLGVTGSNNGTWYSTDPKPPKDGDDLWYHWVAGLKAQMRNGKKAIGFPNSWGTVVGDKGWQWLNEDWFKPVLSNSPYGSTPIWEPRCYVWNDQPAPPSYTHHFSKELQYGNIDPECIELQKALMVDGDFPSSVPYSDHFGPATLSAVQKFQAKYGIASSGTWNTTGYGRVGPKTIAKLNALFDK